MTSSSRPCQQAARVVETICSRLDENLIAQLVDEPIDRAVQSFRFWWEPPFDPVPFHRLIGRLVAHLHRYDSLTRTLAPSESMADEAVDLLAQHYQGAYEPGYDGALLDTVFQPAPPQEGIDGVLEGLAEIMKARRRKEYVDSVFAQHLDPLDSAMRRAIATHIVDRYGLDLSDELALCDCLKLAERVRDLIESIRQVDSIAGQLHRPLLGQYNVSPARPH